MKRSLTRIVLLSAVSFSLASCSGRGNYMAFTDNVVYVEEFPEEYSLTSAEVVNTRALGAVDFKIQDSLIVIGSLEDYAWKILSLDGVEQVTELIRKGNGPGEFISTPLPSQAEFYKEGGETYCYLSDMNKREMYRMNFSESLKTGQAEIETIGTMLPYPAFNLVYIKDSVYYYETLIDKTTRYERNILKDRESSVPNWLEELNSAHVNPGVDFNLLSAGFSYNRERNLIVETPICLNNINLYTLDGEFRKTVNIGRRLSDIDNLQKKERAYHPYTFATALLYDTFFSVLYLGETNLSYQMGRTQMPHIYCFDYEGNPLADILLDEHVTSFDFDFEGGWLYVLDQITDRMWRYALPDGFDLK